MPKTKIECDRCFEPPKYRLKTSFGVEHLCLGCAQSLKSMDMILQYEPELNAIRAPHWKYPESTPAAVAA